MAAILFRIHCVNLSRPTANFITQNYMPIMPNYFYNFNWQLNTIRTFASVFFIEQAVHFTSQIAVYERFCLRDDRNQNDQRNLRISRGIQFAMEYGSTKYFILKEYCRLRCLEKINVKINSRPSGFDAQEMHTIFIFYAVHQNAHWPCCIPCV